MGQIHYRPHRTRLAEAAAAHAVAHVRRAHPPGYARADGTAIYRHEVVEWLRPPETFGVELPSLLEIISPRAFVQQALNRNPYSHPIQEMWTLDGAIQFASAEDREPEFIVFLDVQHLGDGSVLSFSFALGGLRLPLARKDELRALIPRPRPPPPSRGWLARLWSRLRGA